MPADHRYSRFAETVEIVHGLLKGEGVDFDGKYHRVKDSELVLPASGRPPITVGAFKPTTIRLAARFADQWGGGVFGGPYAVESYRPLVEELERDHDPIASPSVSGRRSRPAVERGGRILWRGQRRRRR